MAGRLVVYAAVLFAGFAFNLYGTRSGVYWGRPDLRAEYHGYDAAPVLWRLRAAADGGVQPLGPMVLVDPSGQPFPYLSQFGLPAVVLSAVVRATGADPLTVAVWGGWVAAALAAGVFALIYATAARRYGPLAGHLPVGLTALSPILLAVGPSVYWALAAQLAPFVVAWLAYPWAANSGQRWLAFLGLVGGAVLVKGLCGYEYISAVVLGPVAGMWAAQHASGLPLARQLREAAAVATVGVVGFGLALGVHVAQIEHVVGRDAAAAILDRATARTVSGSGQDEAQHPAYLHRLYRVLPAPVAYPTDCFLAFFDQPAASLPVWLAGPRGRLPLGWVVAGVVGLGVAVRVRGGPTELVVLSAAAGLGLVASASWQVLAVNHMCVHRHLNLIVYHLPFLPLAFVLFGAAAQRLVDRLGWGRAVGPAAALLLAVAVVGGIVADRMRTRREVAGEAEAVRVIEEVLASGRVLDPSTGVRGHVDTVGPETAGHYILRVEHGRAAALCQRSEDADPAVMLTGWAVDGLRLRGAPSARVVVTAGGRVVPAAVVRYTRQDIDDVFGRPLLATGFTAFVPARLVPPGTAVRVFAVPAADPGRLAELPLPTNAP